MESLLTLSSRLYLSFLLPSPAVRILETHILRYPAYLRQMSATELASSVMDEPLTGTSTTLPEGVPLAVSKFWPAQVLPSQQCSM